MTRQPPIGGKDDYDSENSWISLCVCLSGKLRERQFAGVDMCVGGVWMIGCMCVYACVCECN